MEIAIVLLAFSLVGFVALFMGYVFAAILADNPKKPFSESFDYTYNPELMEDGTAYENTRGW